MAQLRGLAAALLVVMVAGSACSSDGGPAGSPSSTVGVGGSASATDVGAFSSAQYNYEAVVPPGWSAEPATSQWDGGDVNHTAGYADRFDGAGSGFIFAIGTATGDPLPEFAEAPCVVGGGESGVHAGIGPAGLGARRGADGAGGAALPGGIYGATLVSKAVVVREGVGVIFTAFSPDSGADTFPAFDDLLASVRWTGR